MAEDPERPQETEQVEETAAAVDPSSAGLNGEEGETEGGDVHIGEIEALLSRLPTVTGARLVVNTWGGIEEVHILSDTRRHPKQIVRDVESALAAEWGIAIDHKKVSVAQLRQVDKPAQDERLEIAQVQTRTDLEQGEINIRITLAGPDESQMFYGERSAPNSDTQALQALCGATLEAASQAAEEGYHFKVIDARMVELGSETAVVCLSQFQQPRGDMERLTGSAIDRGDLQDAAIRAALDAVNRRLARHYAWEHGG